MSEFTQEYSSEELKLSIIQKVARICEISVEEVSLNELSIMYDFSQNPDFIMAPYNLYLKYFGMSASEFTGDHEPNNFKGKFRSFLERAQQINQLYEAYIGKNLFSSYGLFLPTYLKMLGEVKREQGDKNHKSLLVGAFTPDTVIEYRSAMNQLFKDPNAQVVDIAGAETAEPGVFSFGDATSLPYASDSLSTIQTNYLLHSLAYNSNGGFNSEKIVSFFKQAYRCLKPGGSLILLEGNIHKLVPSGRSKFASGVIIRNLKEAGFFNIYKEIPMSFKSRTLMYKHFLSTKSRINDSDIENDKKIQAFRVVK